MEWEHGFETLQPAQCGALVSENWNGGIRYGVFICYEAAFADEVRQFARHGAEVFVNLSDDGWNGDTSALWQHLNMARMRAIEKHGSTVVAIYELADYMAGKAWARRSGNESETRLQRSK